MPGVPVPFRGGIVECYYAKPGACGDLNTALDETAQITLPNGKIIYRHPSCFIVATMNAGENENEYRAVREQDVSFDRRFEGFKEYLDFFREDVFADMISKKSGYTDMDEILMMIKVMKDMNKERGGNRRLADDLPFRHHEMGAAQKI